MPLSQTLELDNSKIIIQRCLKIELDGMEDEIAILNHIPKSQSDNEEFLGWIFKSSIFKLPVNAMFDIRLEECLIEDPILKKSRLLEIVKDIVWNIFRKIFNFFLLCKSSSL